MCVCGCGSVCGGSGSGCGSVTESLPGSGGARWVVGGGES